MPLPKILSVAEVDRLITAARDRIDGATGGEKLRALRLYALIEMLYATRHARQRAGDAAAQRSDGRPRVLTITGKGGRERLVPLNAAPAPRWSATGVGRDEDGLSRRPLRPSGCSPRAAPRATSPASASAQELKSLALDAGLDPERV